MKETRMNKWQWYRDSIKRESESIAKIVYYEEREHKLDEIFGDPIKQLEELMGVKNDKKI